MRTGRRLLALSCTAALACGLAACSGPTRWSDFDRPPDDRDVLPAELTGLAERMDPDSIRFAGTVDDVSVYLATPAEGDGRCVLLVSAYEPTVGCGDEISLSGVATVRLSADGERAEPESSSSTGPAWTPLGDNVSVRIP